MKLEVCAVCLITVKNEKIRMDRPVSKAYILITKLQKKYGFKTKGFIIPWEKNNNRASTRVGISQLM